MCGRVIQSSGPVRYAIVDGMNVRDSRVHNYPPRWNAAPSQELLLQAWLGHKNIQHTVRYTELAPDRFKSFWRS
jgi:hypothetical protein